MRGELVLVQFCELQIYRSSSTVFKLGDNITNEPVGLVVFIITYFHSLIFHQFDDKLTNIICVIHDTAAESQFRSASSEGPGLCGLYGV